MNKSAIQIAALLIAALVAVAAYRGLRDWEVNSPLSSHDSKFSIGSIQSVEGDVDLREPRALENKKVTRSVALLSQALITTHEASSATVVIEGVPQSQTQSAAPPIGAILKLAENTRFAAELDASHPGAVIGTILNGSVSVINPGIRGQLRLFREGRELALLELSNVARGVVPVLPAAAGQKDLDASDSAPIKPEPKANRAEPEAQVGIVITPTRADESASPTPVPADAAAESTEPANEILTNEDIARQMRVQTGFFQRCYLNYLHRTQSAQKPAPTGGVVLMSFTIQSSGHVSDAKVVKSDLNDATLEGCIGEVIERTIFRGFRGNPVPVLEFPISLK